MDSGYVELANAIYFDRYNNSQNIDSTVTLSEAVVVNGMTFNPGTTLKIQKPVNHQQ